MPETAPSDVETMAAAMKRAHVQRLIVGDITIEMHPSAFTQAPAVTADEHPDDDVCRCGHSMSVEHSADGCLKGCEHSACVPSGESDE